MTGLSNRRSLFDLARMLPMKPGAWLVLLVEPQKHDEAISELQLRVHHSKRTSRMCRGWSTGAGSRKS